MLLRGGVRARERQRVDEGRAVTGFKVTNLLAQVHRDWPLERQFVLRPAMRMASTWITTGGSEAGRAAGAPLDRGMDHRVEPGEDEEEGMGVRSVVAAAGPANGPSGQARG